MNRRPEVEDATEALLNRTLRDLPPRPAPPTLESRVLHELERRAALPWWRHGFARWPVAARAAFVLICAALIGATVAAGAWVASGVRLLDEFGAASLSGARQTMAVAASAGQLAALLARSVPLTWLYEAAAVGAVLYVILFGLGAAAYRALYLQPLDGR